MAKAPLDIRSLAREHTEEAIRTLAKWMRSDNPKASVSASAFLIERGWGKAVQPIEGTESGPPIRIIEQRIVDPSG